MKVVLFCGGFGTRLREHSTEIPKPLVPIGERPIIWHLMKYYAHYGHKEFILCLGFGGDLLREYFLNFNPYLSGDFSLGPKGQLEPSVSELDDWKITFVDTGLHSNLGQRLLRVKKYLADEDTFLVNYSDALTDLPLPEYLDFFRGHDAVGGFVAVWPRGSFHTVQVGENGVVAGFQSMDGNDTWVNGGFMVFRNGIFDVLEEGEELVEEPFQRLIAQQQLVAYRYSGFWAAMDTFKDKIMYDRMNGSGDRPWAVWER